LRRRALAAAAAAAAARALAIARPRSTPPNQPKKQAAEKAARAAENAARETAQRGVKQAAPTQADPDDPLKEKYGDPKLVQSTAVTGRTWLPLSALTPQLAESSPTVLVRARLANVRGKGKSAFLVLRERTETVQAVMFADDETVSRGMVRYASAIPKESIVDVEGVLVAAKEPIASCTQSQVELKVRGVWAISRAAGALPFELSDAARSDAEVAAAAEKGELLCKVEQNVRLDNRALDLRTPASQAIFRVQSAVCQLFRNTMLSLGFQEVHTPKLISGASEGGAAVFAADYMGRPACLAQSPQLYKQMAIVADFDRVFEIGPVFRAENSFTHRHLCEFTGLDFEMAIKEHYSEVMDVIERIFMDMFGGIEKECGKDLEAIRAQYPFEPIEAKPLRLTFEGEGVGWLVRGASIRPKAAFFSSSLLFSGPFGGEPRKQGRGKGRAKRAFCFSLSSARTFFSRRRRRPLNARPTRPQPTPKTNQKSPPKQTQIQRASRCCARTATRTSTPWATSTRSSSARWAPP
jgi:aspartyl-tRNA synthetase